MQGAPKQSQPEEESGGGAAVLMEKVAEAQPHPYSFHVSGPRKLCSPNWRDNISSSWKDANYKRTRGSRKRQRHNPNLFRISNIIVGKFWRLYKRTKRFCMKATKKSQKELNEYFQRRKDKIEEDWRKHEVEHLEGRRKYEEEYRAQQHAYMMSMVFSLPHSSTQYEENNSNVIVEDEPKLEDPHTPELNVNVNSNYSGDLEEFQLVDCFDLVVGNKADLEKSQSAQFKLEAEVDNLSAYEHENSAYIMAEDQGSIAWDLSLTFNGLQEIQPKAENKEGSKFAIKHRWPPP
ncbi:hypothetical protein ACLB2K_067192 [Fragaria x ananassa]